MKKLIYSLLIISFIIIFPCTTFAQTEFGLSLFKEFTGEAMNDSAGESVASAGDVNGDGFDDILVGASGSDNSIGAAYLIYGSADKLSSKSLSKAIKFSGELLGDWAGRSVSSAGDVNADGYSDILIGAPGSDGQIGAAYLIYGSADRLTSSSLSKAVKFISDGSMVQVGHSVSTAGDVNGDGYDDILIGTPWAADESNSGTVYLIYGQAKKLTSSSLSKAVKLTSKKNSDSFGDAISLAGDVNNDGYDDILIGASHDDNNGITNTGAAYLIYGKQKKLTSSSISKAVKFTGKAAHDQAGSAVSSAGDVNGDGYDDILIGAPYNGGGFKHGSAYLIYGKQKKLTSSSLSKAVKFNGEGKNDWAGNSVSSAGDVNADGFADILIGASDNDDGGYSAGAAYLIYGRSDKLNSFYLSEAIEFIGEDKLDSAGNSVSQAGDVNGDGYDDILIGADWNSEVSVTSGAAYLGYLYDQNGAAKDIANVVGITDGDMQVTYVDSNSDVIDVFNDISANNTIIKLDKSNTKYHLALSDDGRKIALVDTIDKIVTSTINLSQKNKYAINTLKFKTVRNKDAAIVISKKKDKVLLSIIKINTAAKKLLVKDQEKITNINIDPKNAEIDGNTINLNDISKKTLEKYLVTKKLKLKLKQ